MLIGRLMDLRSADARARAAELLARFDLADAAGRPARTYSGGMRRRLDLAASLVGRPEVIYLDEPTTGLDPAKRDDVWNMVRALVAGSQHAYLQFLLPAIMVQTAMFASTAIGVNLNSDIKKGVFDRFRSLPIARSAPLIGAVAGDVIRFVVAMVVLIGFGSALGFRFGNGPLLGLAACLLVLVFSFCLSWTSVLIGMLVREPGAVQGISFLIMFPLTFGTNMMVPTDTLPGWLQAWVKLNPVTDVMAAARGLMLGGPIAAPVTSTLLWSAALLAVFAPLAYRRRT
ncbi:hypothetical protein GCM10009662_78630 [Catellatospora coxensis]|uniref:Transport permease protein n=3 Tax=Catellatospora coxensis TaxID=310354 RepID=A0A8J3PBA5_9ACTN|nr:hypothetical protein Cco03nite_71440 [Catellatospora coxensis]